MRSVTNNIDKSAFVLAAKANNITTFLLLPLSVKL